MAAKRKSAAKQAPDRSGDDVARGRDVVLEQIQSQMQIVVEAVTGLSARMDERFSALEARLSERIQVLEQVVRQSSEDIKKNSEDIKKNSEDIRVLQQEVARLRSDFDRRAELARMSSLEERVARVEARLGIAS